MLKWASCMGGYGSWCSGHICGNYVNFLSQPSMKVVVRVEVSGQKQVGLCFCRGSWACKESELQAWRVLSFVGCPGLRLQVFRAAGGEVEPLGFSRLFRASL